MASKISVEKMIRPFTGEGDVLAWMQKIELVAKLTGEKDLASFLPLYLEDGALAVYLEMPDAKKTDASLIQQELLKAFTDNEFVAFSKLKAARWAGEPVDVYANELRRLVRGCGFTGDGAEQMTKLAFITGFPDSIGVELQQIQGVEKMKVGDIIPRARVLASNTKVGGMAAPAMGGNGSGSKHGGAQRNREPLECYECKGPHLARFCPEKRGPIECYTCKGNHYQRDCAVYKASLKSKDKGVTSCVNDVPLETVGRARLKVPVINVVVNGRDARALVDTGCTTTMVHERFAGGVSGEAMVSAFDGRKVRCKGASKVEMVVAGDKMEREVTVVSEMVDGVDLVLGMDVIEALGGVKVWGNRVQFGNICAVSYCGKAPDIIDQDFEAWFDGSSWEVRYFWNEKGEPKLRNNVSEYARRLEADKELEFRAEVERWIKEGILVPWEKEVNGVIPLMAVEQPTKNKVRPVLDFRELNEFVSCHTGGDMTDVCGDRLREWRQIEGEGELVDLKAAYLQIKVAEELWQHQLVRYEGRVYALTRLGFGLNSAPRIMTSILKTVLKKREDVDAATSSFIDDIMVDSSRVPSRAVADHLLGNGLESKEPASLEGGSVLGLRLSRDSDGRLVFARGNEVPEVADTLTRRDLFSVCGKLVGHYPKAGWLRVACSYLKRHAAGSSWSDYVGDEVRDRIREVVEEVKSADPVRGVWQAPKVDAGVVWCDASDLAMGAVLEIGGVEVEDASWMRKKDDYTHINVAELEAVLKGINLCAKWHLKRVEIVTDSATVYGWLCLTLTEEKKVKTKGAAEVLVKRRLGIFKSLVEELGLQVTVRLVKSEANKADGLTRIRKKWLMTDRSLACLGLDHEQLKEMHSKHHMGVERSWFLAKKVDSSVDKEAVRRVVRQCQQCQSIDPAPATHVPGELGVDEDWERLAIDTTHFEGRPYLTIVDCGPGRFVLWRELRTETAVEICKILDTLFYERGPVSEVLMDNALAFTSQEMELVLDKWGIRSHFRGAHRASGNGIVERSHRTIKAMAARTGKNPIDAVFWHNVAPKNGQKDETVPQKSIFTYEWRLPGEAGRLPQAERKARFEVGDEVWVKPGNARCTTRWLRGGVTGVNSANNVEINGMPRHVLDLRHVEGEEDLAEEEEDPEPRYPRRDRRAPAWMRDGDYTL